jgi:ABC-type transporter Mla MlaB component
MPTTEAMTVSFEGPMTIQSIDTARVRMIEAIVGSDVIEIDCTQVDNADLSFVQMLLAARLGAHQQGKILRLSAPATGALRAALERGGFADPQAPNAPFWAGE